MQPRAAQGCTYTPFLQKRKMLWHIHSLAVQIEASTSPECLGNRNWAKLEFPRIVFGGNSPHCIKTEADKGHDHYDCSPLPPTDRVLPSQPHILLLYSLGIATVCSAGRIPMQDAA